MEIAKPCGYRLYPEQFNKIKKVSRKNKTTEAEALRRIIDAFKENDKNSRVTTYSL
jgi:hypothetical protein